MAQSCLDRYERYESGSSSYTDIQGNYMHVSYLAESHDRRAYCTATFNAARWIVIPHVGLHGVRVRTDSLFFLVEITTIE